MPLWSFTGCGSLLDMYAKCGCLDEALQTFDEMPERNSISWNAVISAYAHYGQAKNAIKMFEGMLHYGFKPDSVTFLSVLSACSQNGLAKECMKSFELMEHEYGISPSKGHYACVVDTLGRVGRFDKVQKMLSEGDMPWTTSSPVARPHPNDTSLNGYSMETSPARWRHSAWASTLQCAWHLRPFKYTATGARWLLMLALLCYCKFAGQSIFFMGQWTAPSP